MLNFCINDRRLSSFIFALPVFAALFLSGCTAPTAPVAPQSSLSRENALAIAQRTADAMGGRVFTIAPTGSMKPTLDENSVVAVEIVDFGQLRQGDIVIYRDAAGVSIVHRLYQQTGARWLVLGDNNPAVDHEAVTPANLVGRVCAIFYTTPGTQSAAQTALAQR
jgi:signal peptidase I